MDGMQTCTAGVWGMTCGGEVIPTPESCADGEMVADFWPAD